MRLAALVALALLPASAQAQTQARMNETAGADQRRADAAMNRQWSVTQAAMKRRDAADSSRGGGFGYAAALLASQRAWLRFRDAECVIEGAEFAGGSAQPMAQAACLARLTVARTAQLKTLEWRR
ncbi:lysozyme inhibitor LprI family protein [Sphingomonas profundi]|uniref:lysozyme inhibitor LprI family protein n=1 Tax=Alterirhizorhabdus profundi TaxID=2681549 RepID=UPI0012E7390D|nr:lysozyme inhibitor LprI family protein [Sphingomonas profundi]